MCTIPTLYFFSVLQWIKLHYILAIGTAGLKQFIILLFNWHVNPLTEVRLYEQ